MNKQLLFDLFQFPDEDTRSAKREAFSTKAITIHEASGKSITYEEAQEAFRKGFEEKLGLTLVPFELTDEQWEEVRELADAKYRSDDWNLHFRKKVLASGKK